MPGLLQQMGHAWLYWRVKKDFVIWMSAFLATWIFGVAFGAHARVMSPALFVGFVSVHLPNVNHTGKWLVLASERSQSRAGLALGIGISLITVLYGTTRPYCTLLGQVCMRAACVSSFLNLSSFRSNLPLPPASIDVRAYLTRARLPAPSCTETYGTVQTLWCCRACACFVSMRVSTLPTASTLR
jgi:hypothetical protein